MLLGDAAYDVAPGWVGLPVGSLPEHLATPGRAPAEKPGPDPEPRRRLTSHGKALLHGQAQGRDSSAKGHLKKKRVMAQMRAP